MEGSRKKKRRRYVRFEREHSMSMWQGDWKLVGLGDGKERWMIAFMDDASRRIMCYGIYENATAENAIKTLEEGFCQYGYLQEILTDHVPQFTSNKRDRRGWGVHAFEEYLRERCIKHALARVNHHQINGKIERFFGTLIPRTLRQWRKLPPERILHYGGVVNCGVKYISGKAFYSRLQYPTMTYGGHKMHYKMKNLAGILFLCVILTLDVLEGELNLLSTPRNSSAIAFSTYGDGNTYTLESLAEITNGEITIGGNGMYYFNSEITIANGDVLVIHPGEHILFNPDGLLIVNGNIIGEGTESNPISFEYFSDESYDRSIRFKFINNENNFLELRNFSIKNIGASFEDSYSTKLIIYNPAETEETNEELTPSILPNQSWCYLGGIIPPVTRKSFSEEYIQFMEAIENQVYGIPTKWDGDNDFDGMPNWWERVNNLNPFDPTDANIDSDNDGLFNLGEFLTNSNPRKIDTDTDTLKDGDEIYTYHTLPTSQDTDKDAVPYYYTLNGQKICWMGDGMEANLYSKGYTIYHPDVYQDRIAVLFSGGIDKSQNTAGYWNDLTIFYSLLVEKYHYKQSNIYILYADGQTPRDSNCNYDDSHNKVLFNDVDDAVTIVDNIDFKSSSIIEGPGTRDAFNTLLSHLLNGDEGYPKLDNKDIFTLYISNHGGFNVATSDYWINEWGEGKWYAWESGPSNDFCDDINRIPSTVYKNIIMTQCHGGGFAFYMKSPYYGNVQNYVFMYAVDGDHSSWSCNSEIQRNGERYGDYAFGEYLYYLSIALTEQNWYIENTSPSSGWDTITLDENGDGIINLEEVTDYIAQMDDQDITPGIDCKNDLSTKWTYGDYVD